MDEALEESAASTVDEAAAAFGLLPVYEVEKISPLYLWPENLLPWAFFNAVSSQWIVGAGGVVGLNYPSVEVVSRAWRIKQKDWPRLFSNVQVMERATLNAWREKKK